MCENVKKEQQKENTSGKRNSWKSLPLVVYQYPPVPHRDVHNN
jgi:hypothetical protein